MTNLKLGPIVLSANGTQPANKISSLAKALILVGFEIPKDLLLFLVKALNFNASFRVGQIRTNLLRFFVPLELRLDDLNGPNNSAKNQHGRGNNVDSNSRNFAPKSGVHRVLLVKEVDTASSGGLEPSEDTHVLSSMVIQPSTNNVNEEFRGAA